MSALTASPAWQALTTHAQTITTQHMRDWFRNDAGRAERYQLNAAGVYLDYAKNQFTDETLELLLQLAQHAELEHWRERMFIGEPINHTEQRSVLHIALRNRSERPIYSDNIDVMPQVRNELAKLRQLSDAVRSGQWLGFSGEPITDVVNLGIGGSDLGPYMVCQALTPYHQAGLNVHFVSNVDGAHLTDVLANCRPSNTLFIVSSKSFSTQETLNNALAAKAWLRQHGGTEESIAQHFVAVTANNAAATAFGIAPDSQFAMWDWVGGRFSLWSAIGLPIAICIGMDRFEELLDGAFAMDEHFRTAPLAENMPVVLGLLGVWYNNFLHYDTHAILPYSQHLASLPNYLQQGDMESNGKHIDRAGAPVDYQTGPVIWGGAGTNAQHAFFQLMHQGSKTIPADFILSHTPHSPLVEQHRMLLANGIAQMEALMRGKTEAEVQQELSANGMGPEKIAKLAPYRAFVGNKPSNAIVLEQLTPASLGALIALYEHKIFVQGCIWNINSFDQWGVEYGKQMAQGVLQALEGAPAADFTVSDSTQALIDKLK